MHPLSKVLQSQLQQRPCAALWVGFSGGMDSTVLLQCAAEFGLSAGIPVTAVHINHGLQSESADWAQQAAEFASSVGAGFHCETLQLPGSSNIEARAREARYRIFSALLQDDDCLLLAHHRDDQAETVLQRLLRGGGSRGLSAMTQARPLGRGTLLRPFLGVSREHLRAAAAEFKLSWIEDPSNTDSRFQRNWLRHEVLPVFFGRYPAFAETLAEVAVNATEEQACLDALAGLDLQKLVGRANSLSITGLMRLPEARRNNVLRHWLAAYGLSCGRRLLEEITQSLLGAGQDAQPLLQLGEHQLRRHDGSIYCLSPLPPPVKRQWIWDGRSALDMGPAGTLTVTAGGELMLPAEVSVQLREGGERCRPLASRHSKPLKKLLNEWRVPVWLRNHLPLIVVDGEVAAIANLAVCEGFAGGKGRGISIHWESPLALETAWESGWKDG